MIVKRLEDLRAEMVKYNFDGYMVPSSDEYLNEYVPDHSKRLEYITGFTGSNGLAVILNNISLFFTDGRYLNQCSQELNRKLFMIFDIKDIKNFPWKKYIKENDVIGYDPKLFRTGFSIPDVKIMSKNQNLIDIIWNDQPEKPNSKIYDYPVEYSGQEYMEKVNNCRNILKNHNAEAIVITDPASVCWLYNIRAHDIEFSPILLAYAIITTKEAYLFTNKSRISKYSVLPDVKILEEDDIVVVLETIKKTIIFDKNQASSFISSLINKNNKSKHLTNPCMIWKSCKNSVEIDWMKKIHIQDAVSVCEMLSFISNYDNLDQITEHDIVKKLHLIRKKGKNYMFDSFPTICGYRENAAIIHYNPKKESSKYIKGNGLMLLDSGGQYFGGTTDITRTVSINQPKVEHKKYYTIVLKGHIALAKCIFPKDRISGGNLDCLARQYLWNNFSDYPHGTGHGVGNFLNVHEGPQNISLGSAEIIRKGMVISNEPGYYVDNSFGIRIENMMYVTQADKNFLCFKNLTLVPYEKSLIDVDMLSESEKDYITSYYLDIKKIILPLLSDTAKSWLNEQILVF